MAAPWCPPHGWWDDYLEKEIPMKGRCECDYDCVGDPPRYERCNYKILCPVHDTCQICDERLAVLIVDGDKCCAACAVEEIQACPNCNWDSGFTEHSATGREPYGEQHDDVWLICKHCGKQTDDAELASYNAARLAEIKQRLEALKEKEYVGK